MASKSNTVLMVGLSAASAGALFATAWYGIPAAIVGVCLGAASGIFALRRPDKKPQPNVKVALAHDTYAEKALIAHVHAAMDGPEHGDDESREREARYVTAARG
jgi:hypothetical protein